MAFRWATQVSERVRQWSARPLARNILSNYLTVVWLGGLGLAMIPVYLGLLGPEQWGIVAICLTIQTFAGLLDAGLAQILPRDIARCQGDERAQARVYRIFSRAYLGMGLFGFCAGQLVLSLLFSGAVQWFDASVLAHELALRTVLLQFFFQFANNASMGYWNGRQMQAQANARQCIFGTLKHLMALALMLWLAPDALSYVAGFALVSAGEWWLNRAAVRGAIAAHSSGALSLTDFRRLGSEAGVLALGVLIGMLVSQVDRIILSSQVNPVDFGRYVIVLNLGLAFLQLQYPLMRALFPRVVAAQAGQHPPTRALFAWLVMVLCVLPCLLMIPLAPWVLQLWLKDAEIVAQGVAPLRLILAGVAINGFYHLIYQKIIAHGDNHWVLAINAIVLIAVTSALLLTAGPLGILAGGWAWFIMASLQLALALIWLATRGKIQPEKRTS